MMQFIDEKLSKKENKGGRDEHKPMTAEDELYIIPEHLKLENPQESQENGADTWLTGIVEVELPLDEKLRNIEETERAKRKILEERRAAMEERLSTFTGQARPPSKPPLPMARAPLMTSILCL